MSKSKIFYVLGCIILVHFTGKILFEFLKIPTIEYYMLIIMAILFSIDYDKD